GQRPKRSAEKVCWNETWGFTPEKGLDRPFFSVFNLRTIYRSPLVLTSSFQAEIFLPVDD
ncbi:MAG: hypothetical protein MK133_08470, partial [Planctomycetes bacterium]|nr:hypothetical protein [Planctomycetota bacterium]